MRRKMRAAAYERSLVPALIVMGPEGKGHAEVFPITTPAPGGQVMPVQ